MKTTADSSHKLGPTEAQHRACLGGPDGIDIGGIIYAVNQCTMMRLEMKEGIADHFVWAEACLYHKEQVFFSS